MTFYEEMQGIASEILGEFDQGGIVLRRATPGSTEPPYSPWNPGPPSTQDIPLRGVARGVSKEFIDGTLIVASDLQATVAVPPVEPAMSDKIVVDAHEHSLVKIDRIPPAGVAVAYRFFFRA